MESQENVLLLISDYQMSCFANVLKALSSRARRFSCKYNNLYLFTSARSNHGY